MDLPSFLWLWKIAAWSMGLSVCAYLLLGCSGWWMYYRRMLSYGVAARLKLFHYMMGAILVFLVLLLLGIGLVGTLGHYGNLGHSFHLWAGLLVVVLVLISAASATQINSLRPWMRSLHVGTNLILFAGLLWVSWTGWQVVQKYLP